MSSSHLFRTRQPAHDPVGEVFFPPKEKKLGLVYYSHGSWESEIHFRYLILTYFINLFNITL
jgi:hypothetical protein